MPSLVFLFRFLLWEIRKGSPTPQISFIETPRPTIFQLKNVFKFFKYYDCNYMSSLNYYYSVIHYIDLFSLFIYFYRYLFKQHTLHV